MEDMNKTEAAIKEKDLACTLDYEQEYYRLMEAHKKLCADLQQVQSMLNASQQELSWHKGFETAVQLIFSKHNYKEVP